MRLGWWVICSRAQQEPSWIFVNKERGSRVCVWQLFAFQPMGCLVCISQPGGTQEPALPPQAALCCKSGVGSFSPGWSFHTEIFLLFCDSWLNMVCVSRLSSWDLERSPPTNSSFLAQDALESVGANPLTRVLFQKQTFECVLPN